MGSSALYKSSFYNHEWPLKSSSDQTVCAFLADCFPMSANSQRPPSEFWMDIWTFIHLEALISWSSRGGGGVCVWTRLCTSTDLSLIHLHTHASMEFTTTWSDPHPHLSARFFWWEENERSEALRGCFWWQALRETGGRGRGDGLIHWLFISFQRKQMFPCPAHVLACSTDWASYFCHRLAAHNLWGTRGLWGHIETLAEEINSRVARLTWPSSVRTRAPRMQSTKHTHSRARNTFHSPTHYTINVQGCWSCRWELFEPWPCSCWSSWGRPHRSAWPASSGRLPGGLQPPCPPSPSPPSALASLTGASDRNG